MNNDSISIIKKKIQKEIINELNRKEIIDFCKCIDITKKLEEDIIKLENQLEEGTNIIIKIPV